MSLPSKKTIFLILLFLLPVIASATYATYRHSAFVLADGKDIDLNGQMIGNGTILSGAVTEYVNHIGTIDNYTMIDVYSSGNVTTNGVFHGINITSGQLAAGEAAFQTKDSLILSSRPVVMNFLFQDFANGIDGDRRTYIGLKNSRAYACQDCVAFYVNSTNHWHAYTGKQTALEYSQSIPTPANSSLLTIITTNLSATFLINGEVVARSSTYLPTNAVYPMVNVVNHYLGGAPSQNRSMTIDFFSVKKYY